ncbi:MAG: aspartate kinase [Pseudomonadota bacterium]
MIRNVKVVKFSGDSLKNKDSFAKAAQIVSEIKTPVCLVLSGSRAIHELISSYCQVSQEQPSAPLLNRQNLLAAIEDISSEEASQLGLSKAACDSFKLHLNQSLSAVKSISKGLETGILPSLSETKRALHEGEAIWGLLLKAGLLDLGIRAAVSPTSKIIKLQTKGPEFVPEQQFSERAAKEILNQSVENQEIIILCGSFGEINEGLMKLTDPSSDYIATLVADYMGASEVYIYKEGDGFTTSDSRHVFDARVVPELHYREAQELGFFGGKVLHPKVFLPLIPKSIPLTVKNIFHPERPGTRISSVSNFESFPVKAVSFVENQSMLTLEGRAMQGVPGTAAKTFAVMAENKISVSFISQTSSETSICFIVPGRIGQKAKQLLDLAFADEIANHFIDAVRLEENLAIIAIVGLGMKGTPGIAARAFQAIAKEDISISAIAQGSSELNISIVSPNDLAPKALRALHKEYGLERLRAIPSRNPQVTHLYLNGLGQIGQKLTQQLLEQNDFLATKLKLKCPIIGVSDTSGQTLCEAGFSSKALLSLLQQKSHGLSLKKITEFPLSRESSDLWGGPWSRKIFVDVTNSDSLSQIKQAIISGFHVVLANKKPLAAPYTDYRDLLNLAETHQVRIRYEATVGAGLPILDTLEKLASSGDEIIEIHGCFSGTLGYLMTQLEEHIPFSKALKDAHAKGFTEPDPRDDLSGIDVARKALILARFIGLKIDLSDISLTSLVPEALNRKTTQEFLEELETLDLRFSELMTQAQSRGHTLRYVASISKDHVSVGIKEVPLSSSLGRLRGTDNQVAVKTKRYYENPLIVTGPGAGAEVTAAGVLNDIVSIASSQERTNSL